MSKRTTLEISADVLRTAKKGAVKTHIMHKSNLNFKITEKYLEHLRRAGLIMAPIGEGNIFLTTDKGVKYLHQFENLKSYLEKPCFRT